MLKIIKSPKTFNGDSTLLSVLITILNFSSSKSIYIIQGMQNLGFMRILEEIIHTPNLALSVKSVALLTISNMFSNNGTPEGDDELEESYYDEIESRVSDKGDDESHSFLDDSEELATKKEKKTEKRRSSLYMGENLP